MWQKLPHCESGVVHLDGNYRTGAIEFPENCTFSGKPGTQVAMLGKLHFLQSLRLQGSIIFRKLPGADHRCLDVEGSVDFVDPEIEFVDCGGHQVDDGGALYVEKLLTINGGNVTFRNGTATYGGCLFVGDNFSMRGGWMSFQGCSADYGGSLYVLRGHIYQSGGRLQVKNSRASFEGGAMYVQGFVEQTGGVMTFYNCTTRGSGGAVDALGVRQLFKPAVGSRGPVMNFRHGHSDDNSYGGALRVGFFEQSSNRSRMTFQHLSASFGGAIEVSARKDERRWSDEELKKMGLEDLLGEMVVSGTLTFVQCQAKTGNGGAIKIKEGGFEAMRGSHLSFHHCYAMGSAGSIWAEQRAFLLGTADFLNVSAGTVTVMFSNLVKVMSASFRQTGAPQIFGTNMVVIGEVSFAEIRDQAIVSSADLKAKSVWCEPGMSAFAKQNRLGCERCQAHYTQLSATQIEFRIQYDTIKGPCMKAPQATIKFRWGPEDENATVRRPCNEDPDPIVGFRRQCVNGPEHAIVESARLRMEHGYMLESANVSRAFRCPNPNACFGGEVTPDSFSMCSPGYEGRGCAQCSSSHGPADDSAHLCMKCATQRRDQLFQMAQFILQDVLVFLVSASGVTKATGNTKESSVFTNQFMSFVAVASPVLHTVRQSRTFLHTTAELSAWLLEGASVLDLGNADSTDGGICTSCLLGYMGLPVTSITRISLLLLTPVCSVVALALIQNIRLAMVVGVNCFLPKICMCFGRYLVCYRMEPADSGGELFCEHAKAGLSPTALWAIVAALAFAGPALWMRLINDKSNIDTGYYLYLTSAYKDEFKWWEVTRLVRKTLLAIVCAVFPLTLHPVTEIFCISLILIVATVLEMQAKPYKKANWNRSEKCLLITSMFTVNFAIYQLALDFKGGEFLDRCLMLAIILLALVPAYIQLSLILRELVRERFGREDRLRSRPDASDTDE